MSDPSETKTKDESSYGQILKSSTMVGGSQAAGLFMGIVRTKALAIILGPLGPSAVGLLGIFYSMIQMVSVVFGMGIGGSGIREIALAHATGNPEELARVLKALRRTLNCIGLFGSLAVVAAAPWLCQWSFGNSDHVQAIRWLGIVVLLTNMASGQTAILQGRRMMRQLALLGIVASVAGTALSVSMFYLWGIRAVMPSMLVLAVSTTVLGWLFTRSIPVPRVVQDWHETWIIARKLCNLGTGFLVSNILSLGMTWVVQMLIVRSYGDHALGQYNSAFRVSGFLVTFVLSAMTADFFPRLSAVSNDHPRMCRLINEQIEVGALLSVPALLGMLCFADWVIPGFYSREFADAVPMFRWLVLGCLGRVFSWPLGSVFMAKGSTRGLVISELLAASVHLLGVWFGLWLYGPVGAALAFFTMYVLYFSGVYFVMRRWIGFAFSGHLRTILLVLLVVLAGVVWAASNWPVIPKSILGCVVFAFSAFYSLRRLAQILGEETALMHRLQRLPVIGKWI